MLGWVNIKEKWKKWKRWTETRYVVHDLSFQRLWIRRVGKFKLEVMPGLNTFLYVAMLLGIYTEGARYLGL